MLMGKVETVDLEEDQKDTMVLRLVEQELWVRATTEERVRQRDLGQVYIRGI